MAETVNLRLNERRTIARRVAEDCERQALPVDYESELPGAPATETNTQPVDGKYSGGRARGPGYWGTVSALPSSAGAAHPAVFRAGRLAHAVCGRDWER